MLPCKSGDRKNILSSLYGIGAMETGTRPALIMRE